MKHLFRMTLVFTALFTSAMAVAQSYPQKPVKIIVGSAAGGPIDLVARLTATKLSGLFSQQFLVENRLGAGGTIAAEYVARAPRDGYTLSMGSQSTLCSAPALYPKLAYNPVTDFAPIGLVAGADFVLVVHPSTPASSVRDFIALAKARPGQLSFGSAGSGSGTHLSAELFKSMANLEVTHIPYKGGSQAVVDLLSGQLTFMFDTITNSAPHIKSGKLKALGVTRSSRSALLPDIQTIAEGGVPGYESSTWFGLLGPVGTPREIVIRLNDGLRRSDDELRKRMLSQGLEPMESTPEQFSDLIKVDLQKWTEVIRRSGTRLE